MLHLLDGTTSFKDLLNGNLGGAGSGTISFADILVVLGLSLIFGLIIYFTYKYSYKGVVYSQAFNVSLVVLTMIIAVLLLVVSSNVYLSLGMVGALSIVRFRTAIKDPLDIVYLFWSVAIGIMTGVKFFLPAAVGTIVIAVVLFVMLKLNGKKPVYLLIIRYNTEVQPEIGRVLAKLDGKTRNRNAAGGVSEITVEMHLKNNNTSFVERIADIEGVLSCNLVSYNGDFVE